MVTAAATASMAASSLQREPVVTVVRLSGRRRARRPPVRPATRGASADGRVQGVDVVSAAGQEPGDQGVGVPHLPARSSSRPQVAVGNSAARTRTSFALTGSLLSRRGLSTASAASGMTPPGQQRTS